MDLKEQVDIKLQDPQTILELYKDFLGEYTRQSDKEYKFSSPDGSDSTPSFGVDPNRLGMFKDFSGSGKGGNIWSFLKMKFDEGDIQKKPLLWLADYFRIEVKTDPNAKPKLFASERIMQQATQYLANNPHHKQLLYDKGFAEAEITGFNGVGIGYLNNDVYRNRYFIPVIDNNDRLVNVRLYDPTNSSPGMKVISFYMHIKSLSGVPDEVQKAIPDKDMKELQEGRSVKLTGFGEARLGYLKDLKESDTIYIMEGERDFFNAKKHGLPATWVTGGANTWKMQFNSWFTKKHVRIVMDNDKSGWQGAYKKADFLGAVAKSVKVIRLPLEQEGSDFSDYMADHTIDQFNELVEQAEEYRITHVEQHKPKVIIGEKSAPRWYGKYLYSTMDLVFVNKQGFYTYQEEGFWKGTDDLVLEDKMFKLYERMNFKEPTTGNLGNSMKALMHSNFNEERPEQEHKFVNCKNGLYDIKGGMMIPHTKSIFTTYQLPVDYSTSSECPRFMQYLHEVFPEDTDKYIDLIGEILGYCMTSDNSFQKAFIFIGTGANGKSVLIEILEALVGEQNVSSVGFNDLANSFSRSQLQDKLVNVGAEIEFSTTANSSYFKQIVAGDTISAQEKYKPEYIFKPKCKLVYSTNGFPATKDRSEGNFRRYLFVPFNVYFPEEKQDKQLVSKLKGELSGILNFAMQGMKRLYKNERFTAPAECLKMLNEFKATASPFLVFFAEEAELKEDNLYKRSVLVRRYKAWCEENGYRPMSTQRISKELFDNFKVPCIRKKDGEYYSGITLKEVAPETWASPDQAVVQEKELEPVSWC